MKITEEQAGLAFAPWIARKLVSAGRPKSDRFIPKGVRKIADSSILLAIFIMTC